MIWGHLTLLLTIIYFLFHCNGLFTELLTIVEGKYFKNGKPVNSMVALNVGDFKTCGAVMGMSILQGGPAPNFLAPDIVSYLVGELLCPSENQDPLLRKAAETVSNNLNTIVCAVTFTCVLNVKEEK